MSTETAHVIYPKRRWVELAGVLIASLIGVGALLLTHYNRDAVISRPLIILSLGWVALCVVAHLLVRRFASYSDPAILPIVLSLNGLGLAMIHRLDLSNGTSGATSQLMWTVLGLILFGLVLIFVKDYRNLNGLPYVLFIVGMGLLLLPLVPGLSAPAFGAKIWIKIAGYSFQPAEVAKVVLTLAFASYLAENKDLLKLVGPRIGKLTLPRMRDLAPIVIMWLAALVVLVFENDFGTSLLFFGLFVMMIYVATGQARWIIITAIMFGAAAIAIAKFVPHVAVRLSSWLDPFSDYDNNYQIIQAQFGMAWGGLNGRGWGLGRPQLIPLASSDFVSAAIGEELGLIGLVAVVILYMLLVSRSLKAALGTHDEFGKLLASGLSFVFALQVFVIIGGATRLLPLTGLTTPFMSQGGSSLVANWVIVALVMEISHEARRPRIDNGQSGIEVNLANERTQVIKIKPDKDPVMPASPRPKNDLDLPGFEDDLEVPNE